MNSIYRKRILSTSFILTLFFLTTVVHAQKYKSMSDTARLNKEYGEISLEIAKLNTKLMRIRTKLQITTQKPLRAREMQLRPHR